MSAATSAPRRSTRPRRKHLGRRSLPAAQRDRLLRELGEWLQSESVAFAALDRFRQGLRLTEETFAAVLGVSPETYASWRRRRAVPTRNRDKMDRRVLRYWSAANGLADGLESAERTAFSGVADATSGPPAWAVLMPSRTTTSERTPETHPALHVPPDRGQRTRERSNLKALLRAAHAPQPGDGYAACECAVCARAPAPAAPADVHPDTGNPETLE